MLRIATVDEHKRMSTQQLLQTIADAVANGETDFQIRASGQHDIGGPLWNSRSKELRFTVSNPGQRVGSMCLPGTYVLVEGPAPADVGWLNSGGTVVVKGDAGDTAGHCAAGGKIFIGGRAGARSGSLMKHDPLHEAPELWILKNTGSFSFEFMGGGKAIVCGHDSLTLPTVLGQRPCVGMVGGVVYFRGACPELPDDIQCQPLEAEDIAFLDAGLDQFLQAIAKPGLKKELSLWKHWRKLLPRPGANEARRMSMRQFHADCWIPGGLFGDVLEDDACVEPLVPTGDYRLREPVWENENNACQDCKLCLQACPRSAIKRRTVDDLPIYSTNPQRCIGCGICAALCPAHVWHMKNLL